MRVRYPFAISFLLLLLLSAYLGLSPSTNPPTTTTTPKINDKLLHLLTFTLLTLTFYWTFDTSRRRALNLSLLLVTLTLGLGSEALQSYSLRGTRAFDPLDIVANIVGSLLALGLCTVYHKRMLDRRRRAKGYGLVPPPSSSSLDGMGGEGEEDLEMGDQGRGNDAGESSTDGEGRLTPSSAENGDEAMTGMK